MLDFINNHAQLGGKFNYFAHSDEVTFEVMEVEGKTFKLKRPIPAATVGEFEYDFKFKISRVL